MRFDYAFESCTFFGVALSLAVDPPWKTSDRVTTPTLPANSSWSVIPSNETSSLGPRPKATCNGDLFGYDLNVLSCNLAMANIPPDTHQITFGIRHTGHFGISLPYRFYSRKWEAMAPFQRKLKKRSCLLTHAGDGTCYIEPVLRRDVTQGSLAWVAVRRAATNLIGRCAGGAPSIGGMIAEIGTSTPHASPDLSN